MSGTKTVLYNDDSFGTAPCLYWATQDIVGPDGTWTGWVNGTLDPERGATGYIVMTGHPAIDTTRSGVIGASFGGVPAIIYTSQAGSLGLPVPKGLFLHAPCEEYCGIRVPAGTTLPAGSRWSR